MPEGAIGGSAWISAKILRSSQSAGIEARRAPSTIVEHAPASNIHAGMTTPASSAIVQTNASSPARFSR
jgi:hypothetical protein